MSKKNAFLNFMKYVCNTLFPPKKLEGVVGRDLQGNIFCEYPIPEDSKAKRPKREFVPLIPDRIDTKFMSAEWLSWLQHRRKEPPTLEELIRNKEIADMKKINARNIAIREGKSSEIQPSRGQNFPVYNEYTSVPFADYMDYDYMFDKDYDKTVALPINRRNDAEKLSNNQKQIVRKLSNKQEKVPEEFNHNNKLYQDVTTKQNQLVENLQKEPKSS